MACGGHMPPMKAFFAKPARNNGLFSEPAPPPPPRPPRPPCGGANFGASTPNSLFTSSNIVLTSAGMSLLLAISFDSSPIRVLKGPSALPISVPRF